jgi:hypothetical protein
MKARWLCWIGFHKWQQTEERWLENPRAGVLRYLECLDCGKRLLWDWEDGEWIDAEPKTRRRTP